MNTSTKIFIPRDTASISMGGDEVASKIEEIAQKEKKEVTIIRNGSWGMSWLEPLIEIEIEGHRVAFQGMPIVKGHNPVWLQNVHGGAKDA